MKKLIAEKQLEQKKKGSKIIYLIVALFIVLSVVRIFVANRLVDYSQKLHDMENKEAQLTQENTDLTFYFAKVSSLSTIRDKAIALGFTEAVKVTYLDSAPKVAANLP